MQDENIQCPKCGEKINVQSLVYRQIKAKILQENLEIKQKFEAQMEQKQNAYEKALKELNAQKASIEERIISATKESLKQERAKLQETMRQEVTQEYSAAIENLQKELNIKSEQVKELNASKVEIDRLRREKDEIESRIKAQEQERLSKEMTLFKEKFQKEVEDKNAMRFREKEQQLESLKIQIEEMKRKAELTSQQLQGEVQELAIEEYLKAHFALDEIVEIKKGASGADCLQIVHTREIPNCGQIYYESKRTKAFSKEWIEKLKNDMRQKGVEVGVIVTETMPVGMERMGLLEGVWVCSFEEFKALCAVLREGVISVQRARKSQENKHDKMHLLYHYLTSAEFKMQIEAIVEGFTQMQSDLDAEKRAMQRLWKQREKQLQKVLANSIDLYGAIQGIAGSAIGNIKQLELPFNEE
ncbi:DUF2130 domain-containing protein [Helicobacter sp.]|uniref:DUF2130 domain-containing protein n=1 Tax=Helicobacter sp. TaxID=218 RepID=UPI002A91FA87|nr:DUF2130 domain-containing protein [Helicobacter sp.]MDY5557002.1 DUF2130 domain-containing protein [Helicobacter sp.]